MFDDDLYKIKFIFSIFIVKFLKSFILNTNDQILYKNKFKKIYFNQTNEIFENMDDPKLEGIS